MRNTGTKYGPSIASQVSHRSLSRGLYIIMSCATDVPCALTEANLDFTLSLFSQLASDSSDNIFYSPLSISLAFALVHLGAKENTAREIADVFRFNKVQKIDEAFKKLSDLIHNDKDRKSALHSANRLFGRSGFDFLSSYLEESKKFYDADLQSMDFAGDAEGSRKVINAWVEKQTADKIKDLIPEGVINSMTAMVLVNAIYFKGEWKDKFTEAATHKADFHLNANDKVQADFMKKKHKYPISIDKDLGATVIELPYSDDNLSMFVFLPEERFALAQVASKLNTEKLKSIFTGKVHPSEIILKFPKFKFEQGIELHKVLPGLGVRDVFDQGKADLSGVESSRMLFLSHAIHKAFVEVNEEGTEAAAATAGIMMLRCAPRPPPEVTVDHPFLFAIVEKKSSSVLFFGRVSKPKV